MHLALTLFRWGCSVMQCYINVSLEGTIQNLVLLLYILLQTAGENGWKWKWRKHVYLGKQNLSANWGKFSL